MGFHGVLADEQPLRDLGVGGSVDHRLHHLDLPTGEQGVDASGVSGHQRGERSERRIGIVRVRELDLRIAQLASDELRGAHEAQDLVALGVQALEQHGPLDRISEPGRERGERVAIQALQRSARASTVDGEHAENVALGDDRVDFGMLGDCLTHMLQSPGSSKTDEPVLVLQGYLYQCREHLGMLSRASSHSPQGLDRFDTY